jgi:hypothetical protein
MVALSYRECPPPVDLARWIACFREIKGVVGQGTGFAHRVLPDGEEIGMAPVSTVRKVTPVLVVDQIEPAVVFWSKLEIKPSVQVPAADGRLAFVILSAEGLQIMYQTAASVREDLVASASDAQAFRSGPQQATLYVDVDNLAEVEQRLAGERLIMPRRKTFYGAIEVGYTDPAGNIVVFGQHAAEAG